jgi:hypothetical protein
LVPFLEEFWSGTKSQKDYSYVGYYSGKRATIIVPSLIIGTAMMVMTNYLKGLPDPFWTYIFLVFMIGFFIGGVYNNIVGGIAVELGRQFKSSSDIIKILENKKAVATVAAVIEGYGSTFAAVNQLIVPYLD